MSPWHRSPVKCYIRNICANPLGVENSENVYRSLLFSENDRHNVNGNNILTPKIGDLPTTVQFPAAKNLDIDVYLDTASIKDHLLLLVWINKKCLRVYTNHHMKKLDVSANAVFTIENMQKVIIMPHSKDKVNRTKTMRQLNDVLEANQKAWTFLCRPRRGYHES